MSYSLSIAQITVKDTTQDCISVTHLDDHLLITLSQRKEKGSEQHYVPFFFFLPGVFWVGFFGMFERCSSNRLDWTFMIRLKKSSSGTVGCGSSFGSSLRWSSSLVACGKWKKGSRWTFSLHHGQIINCQLIIVVVVGWWVIFLEFLAKNRGKDKIRGRITRAKGKG